MPPEKKPDSSIRDTAIAFSMGTNFVLTFVVVAGIGYAIDRWARGGGYLFTMIGTGLGLVLAVTRIILDTQRMEAAERRRRERERKG
jgi:F0F1-type ATP synthase assembly protein I